MEGKARYPAVAPLTRTTRQGVRLRRPAGIESEIAAALAASPEEIRRRATEKESPMSSECLVHLIRRDLRQGSRSWAEELTPILLARCEKQLAGAVRGFPADTAAEIREDVLGRLAVSLLEEGDGADFLEVRFALALKRLRIDACRRQRRRDRGRVTPTAPTIQGPAGSDPAGSDPPAFEVPDPARQEDRLLIRQALAALSRQEREVLVLHRLAGMPLATRAESDPDLVHLLGFSERTLRNRLRAAEAKLQAFREVDR